MSQAKIREITLVCKNEKKKSIESLYILLGTIYDRKYISSPILAVIGKQGVVALLKAAVAAVIAVGLGLF